VTLDLATLVNAVSSHAQASGHLAGVYPYELIAPPIDDGVVAGVWLTDIAPIPARSGLSATTARVVLTVQLYRRAEQVRPEQVDRDLTAATDALMRAYSGDLDLSDYGAVGTELDLLGAYGDPLRGQARYIPFADALTKVHTITVPLVVTDLWTQGR
jgi:hypothetical protein